MKNVLFIGCHCDDIELGCGATISKYRHKWNIHCLVLSQITPNNDELSGYCLTAMEDLGVGRDHITFHDLKPSFFNPQTVWEILKAYEGRFDTIFSQVADTHQDHECLHKVTNRVFKKESLIYYCSSSLGCPNFTPNYFESIEPLDVTCKLRSLSKYTIYEKKPYFDNNVVRSRMVCDGLQAGSKYSEGFLIGKIIRD